MVIKHQYLASFMSNLSDQYLVSASFYLFQVLFTPASNNLSPNHTSDKQENYLIKEFFYMLKPKNIFFAETLTAIF